MNTVTTASDLMEDIIRTESPFYGMETASKLLHKLEKRNIGEARSLRFQPSYDRQKIDTETDAKWVPVPLGKGTEGWILGQLTMSPEHVGKYFHDLRIDETQEALVPEMFIADELIVSERARDLIATLAADACYFTPVKLIRKESGTETDAKYFKVMIRTCLYYDGPRPKEKISPQGAHMTIVDPATWTSFCQNKHVIAAASKFHIFLFDRMNRYPILGEALLKHLKAAQISGLLEGTERNKTEPRRSSSFHGFETIFPLDPDFRG